MSDFKNQEPRTKNHTAADDVKTVAEAWANSKYYARAEEWTHVFWGPKTHFRRLFDRLDLTSVVELACGHGRHAAQTAVRAGHLTLIDIFEANLAACRERLAGAANVDYILGCGLDFQPLPDNSITAIYCYDAMVHFAPSMVEAYLLDAARVLKPGGMALFHHSNYPAPLERHYGQNPNARNHMTAALFAHYAENAGLTVVESIIIPWGKVADLDCLTLLRK
jgi:ubiquinone/menaquinone biosynthesis C-methylase UbiE